MELHLDLAAIIGTAILALLTVMGWMGKGIITHFKSEFAALKVEVKEVRDDVVKLTSELSGHKAELSAAQAENQRLHRNWTRMLRAFVAIDGVIQEKLGVSFLKDLLPLDGDL